MRFDRPWGSHLGSTENPCFSSTLDEWEETGGLTVTIRSTTLFAKIHWHSRVRSARVYIWWEGNKDLVGLESRGWCSKWLVGLASRVHHSLGPISQRLGWFGLRTMMIWVRKFFHPNPTLLWIHQIHDMKVKFLPRSGKNTTPNPGGCKFNWISRSRHRQGDFENRNKEDQSWAAIMYSPY
jgi:hypothetical protein